MGIRKFLSISGNGMDDALIRTLRVVRQPTATSSPDTPAFRFSRWAVRRYMCAALLRPTSLGGATQRSTKKTKAPRERGFNRGAEGWGARAARCHSSNNSAAISFPSKTQTAECEAFPPSPNGARPALRLPPVPTGMR
jgi:hypothetical protein